MKELMNLMKVMQEINTIYLSLYKYECFHDRENGYFFELVNDLKILLIKEEGIFNKLVNSSEYAEIKDYLMVEEGPVFKRIRDYISRYDKKNNVDDDETVEKNIIGVRKLCASCSKNIFLVYLSYLQDYIDTTKDNVMREKLLNLKYYDTFISLEIGELLINNDFYIPRINYVDLYLIADILGVTDDISYDMIVDANLLAIKEMIKQLFSIDDDKYNDVDIKAASKNMEFMIRACLSIINDNEYEYVRDSIFLLMDEFSNDNNNIAFDIVDKIMDERNDGKCRVIKLSLKPIE